MLCQGLACITSGGEGPGGGSGASTPIEVCSACARSARRKAGRKEWIDDGLSENDSAGTDRVQNESSRLVRETDVLILCASTTVPRVREVHALVLNCSVRRHGRPIVW